MADSLDSDSADRILGFVEDVFSGRREMLYEEPRSLIKETPFRCTELEIGIYQPCSVSSCAFHADHPWARNCILHYMVRQGRQHLTNNDLSFLLGASPTSVRSALVKALGQMRQGALKEEIRKDVGIGMMTRLQSPNVCAVCEESFQTPHWSKDGIHYCSPECHRRKPPTMIRIEKDFSLPIRRILKLCAERFATVSVMANAVGVSQTLFREMCAKFEIAVPE